MLSQNDIKLQVAQQALALVKDNTVIGLGSGTTAYFFIVALGEKIKSGLTITAVPTSEHTKLLAKQQGIPLTTLNEVTTIDYTFDGADEIDASLQLIKGGGGALLQEKMVAAASNQLVIIADDSKLVKQLGKFPLPVEVIPYGWKPVQRAIENRYTIKTSLRIKEGKPFITDHGHYILDCSFNSIPDAAKLNRELNSIPGVVENGLFINMATQVIVGYGDGSYKTLIR